MTNVNEFNAEMPEGERPCLQVLEHASRHERNADDPEKAEYFVKVDWLDAVPAEKAVNEAGLVGNQNTVCQPTAQKWRHTVDRLKTHSRTGTPLTGSRKARRP